MTDQNDVPILGKNGKIIKSGHKDVYKTLIKKGDLFVLSREIRTFEPFKIFDKNAADKLYGTRTTSRFISSRYYMQRLILDRNGNIFIRVWKDEHAMIYKYKSNKNQAGKSAVARKSSSRMVGRLCFLRPGMFGTVLGRHELRPSQWHVIIGLEHYSASNLTMRIIKNEQEFEIVKKSIESSNQNITKEEWNIEMKKAARLDYL